MGEGTHPGAGLSKARVQRPWNGRIGSGHRILVADDDELVRKLVHMILTQQGFAVELCEDGHTTLGRALKGGWSLLVLDFSMPHRTGLEVIRDLRARDVGLPIVLMSGSLDDGVIEECGRLGRVECVPKPFDAQRLMEAVAKLVV